MVKHLKPVLFGDADPARFEWFKNHLDEEYGVECFQAKTFQEVKHHLEESNRARDEAVRVKKIDPDETTNAWSILFIADDLPQSVNERVTRERVKMSYVKLEDDLDEWGGFVTVLIQTREKQIDWGAAIPPNYTVLCSPAPGGGYTIDPELDGIGGLERVSSATSLIVWDEEDRALREQIRSLSESRSLKDGLEELAGLISKCINCAGVDSIEVKSIGQGKSGASVFRLIVKAKPSAGEEAKGQEFVLKLSPAVSAWKLEGEVRGHTRAEKSLSYGGYKVHLPTLRKAHRPSGSFGHSEGPEARNEYIVRNGQLCAIHFDFLGGEAFGEVLDLETALVASASMLELRTARTPYAVEASVARAVRDTRADLLETVLQWLCENWYANTRTGLARREVKAMWDAEDADKDNYVAMPPYKLTSRAKGWALSFLESQEAEMAPRFFDGWEQRRKRVSRLVSADKSDAAQLGALTRPQAVTLSRVHGDLNANNVLVWLKYRHPLLIDFPFYQEAGHVLQDFARLEVEIKFAILDRQRDSPKGQLRAFEYTYSQLQLWQEMEDHLLNRWDTGVPRWSSKGYTANVRLCFELVQRVRRRAREVQQNKECPGPAASDFLGEYWPALLYHTVRAIGYPSLSVFKRFLAVYSADSILTRLGCFTDLNGDGSTT